MNCFDILHSFETPVITFYRIVNSLNTQEYLHLGTFYMETTVLFAFLTSLRGIKEKNLCVPSSFENFLNNTYINIEIYMFNISVLYSFISENY